MHSKHTLPLSFGLLLLLLGLFGFIKQEIDSREIKTYEQTTGLRFQYPAAFEVAAFRQEVQVPTSQQPAQSESSIVEGEMIVVQNQASAAMTDFQQSLPLSK